jgi:hypothetical protein
MSQVGFCDNFSSIQSITLNEVSLEIFSVAVPSISN